MICPKCGKELTNTLGGCYICKNCDLAINDLVYRPVKDDLDLAEEDDTLPKGWICPKCGKCLAPWVSKCNCYNRKSRVKSLNVL